MKTYRKLFQDKLLLCFFGTSFEYIVRNCCYNQKYRIRDGEEVLWLPLYSVMDTSSNIKLDLCMNVKLGLVPWYSFDLYPWKWKTAYYGITKSSVILLRWRKHFEACENELEINKHEVIS